MADWGAQLEEWITEPGHAAAAAMAQYSDCAFYAAAPVADDKGWGIVFKEPHEEDILQDDGETSKKMTCDEANCLYQVLETGKAPECGLWLGGNKYRVVRYEPEFETESAKFVILSAAYPKHGVHIIKTPGEQVLAVFYDEDAGQTPGNSKKCAIEFAEYLAGQGY